MSPFSKKIFICYEDGHLDEAAKSATPDCPIVCLHLLLERKCKERSLPYMPLRGFVSAEEGEEHWWKLSHDISREWYRLPSMEFLRYKGIRLAEAPEPIMQAYLAKLFYYLRIFVELKKAHPEAVVQVPLPIRKGGSKSECLSVFQVYAVIDAARMAGFVDDQEFSRHSEPYRFVRSALKDRLIHLYNFLIGLLPRHALKIYMSGYWPHAEPLVPFLEDTDIIVLESKKFLKIPWKQRLEHRMKAMYSHDPISAAREDAIAKITRGYTERWNLAKKDVLEHLQSAGRDLNWNPVLEACEHVVAYSARVIADIDILDGIMKKEKPNLILSMASVGGPHHYFFLMARVAAIHGIPSVELQHATVTSDPRSVFSRIETDYLLSYGDSINRWHEQIGAPKERLIPVGSPRFDRYVNGLEEGKRKKKRIFDELGMDMSKPVLLVIVPFSETYASAVDSYQLDGLMKTISKAQEKIPNLQILFKCRLPKFVDMTREFAAPYFTADWYITGDEDIFPIIASCDAAICNNSTVIYQAVLAKKPLILYPWKRFDSYHAKIYSSHIPLLYSESEAIDALVRVFRDSSYRSGLISKQNDFLKGYLFDGKSSQRVAAILKKIAHNVRID